MKFDILNSLLLLNTIAIYIFDPGIMPKHKYNYKGRSENVLAFKRSAGQQEDISEFLSGDLAAGQSLAAKNRRKALDEHTMRLYETRLMHLEEFASSQGDNAVLFGERKRPFLAVTIMTFLRKFIIEVYSWLKTFITISLTTGYYSFKILKASLKETVVNIDSIP